MPDWNGRGLALVQREIANRRDEELLGLRDLGRSTNPWSVILAAGTAESVHPLVVSVLWSLLN